MFSVIGSNIRVKDYSDDLLKWANDNLQIANPEYTKKLRMGFWVGNTPSSLKLYEIHGDTLILPFGTLRAIYPMIKNHDVVLDFAEKEKVDFKGSDVPLYDYQREAMLVAKKKSFGIIKSAAGSGKTQIAIALVKELQQPTLWITHTQDLLKQSKERAERYVDKSLIGTITEGEVNIGKGITFATVQTMAKLNLSQYKDMWGVVITDECHRVCGSPTSMTMFYKVLSNINASHKYGLSATVHRSDGLIAATFALIGNVIHEVPDDAVADKVMQVGIVPVGTGTAPSYEMLGSDGMLNWGKMLNCLSSDGHRNSIIVDCITQGTAEGSHSFLVLSDRLSHLETLIGMLPSELQKQAVMISGKMVSKSDKIAREKALEDMRTSKKRLLFATYALAKEGLDIPNLDRLILATPQKDYAVITQSIGRIARTSDGKKDAICFDIIDDIPHLRKAYKQRCTTYRKNKCYFKENTR